MSEIKRDQCCKCRWVGTDDEKQSKRSYEYEIESYIMVCPVCRHDEFYEATERKYQNYLKRISK